MGKENCGKGRGAVKFIYILIFAFVVLSIGAPVGANDYFVSTKGSDSNPGTISLPWRTIRHAMNSITAPTATQHYLYVAMGFYEEDFTFKANVYVHGGYSDSWDYQPEWYGTFFKKPTGSAFTMLRNSGVEGVIIYGGLFCDSVSPVIANCRLMMASTSGIVCQNGASPVIINCSIKQFAGHGIQIFSNSSPRIENTVVAMNGWGGIYIAANCRPAMSHVTIAHNFGAGVYAEDTGVSLISNSIIWQNAPDLVNCHGRNSCVGDGDDYPGNYVYDPLFWGFGGFNEYQPIYVANSGSDMGSGDYRNPMKYIRQALAVYSYNLSGTSPYIGRGLDYKDLGAYPSPSEYQKWYGNEARILVVQGQYYESGIIMTIPVKLEGLDKTYSVINFGGSEGIFCRTRARISKLSMFYGSNGIIQPAGYLTLNNVQIIGASQNGYCLTGGGATIEESSIEECAINGLYLSGASPYVSKSSISRNGQTGIFCSNKSYPHIISCALMGNATGIFMNDTCIVNIRDTTFSGNWQQAILATDKAQSTILMSRFNNNSFGVKLEGEAFAGIHASQFYDNGETGVGLFEMSRAKIVNNTICYNKTGAAVFDNAAAEIRNCIIRNNSSANLSGGSASYSNISGGAAGEGNFDADPHFVSAAGRNFHLQATSPCIDRGNHEGVTYRDMDGETRPRGKGIDIGADEADGAWQYEFVNDSQGWKSFSVPQLFTPPVFEAKEGSLRMTCLDSNSYGYWDSPVGAMPIDDDYLYRMRVRMTGSPANRNQCPGIRFRASSGDFQWVEDWEIYSQQEGWASPPAAGREYDFYFAPPARAFVLPIEAKDITLDYDLVNFDGSDAAPATIALDYIRFSKIAKADLPLMTLVKRYEFNVNAEGWQSGGADIFASPISSYFNRALTMQSTNNLNCYGFWDVLSPHVALAPGTLYRVDFTLRTSATAEKVPTIRLRVSTEDFGYTVLKALNSTGDASITLKTTDSVFSIYFYPPQEYANTSLNKLRLACDLVNFNVQDDPAATVIIERVEIFSAPIPVMP